MPQRAGVKTKETSKLKKLSCYWNSNEDTVSINATHTNRAAIKSIKRSAAGLQRKGGICLCGCHYLCHHSSSLPMKKRKFCNDIEETSSSESGDEEDVRNRGKVELEEL
jgi:hypothetical protein